MTAVILPFPEYRSIGYTDNLPALGDMLRLLERNYATLDQSDRNFLNLLRRVEDKGYRAQIETIAECRSIAWSMLQRYGIQ